MTRVTREPRRIREHRFAPYPEYRDSGVEWLGEIPAHWNLLPLKRVCSLQYGDSLAEDDRVDGEVAVYGSNGAVGTHNVPNALGPCIIVGRKGSFGKVTYSENAVFAIDTTFFVDEKTTTAHIRWLYYALMWLGLDRISKDSAVPGLNREDAYARILSIPPEDEQPAISDFLDRETTKIDTLVAKKERLIEVLQEKRSALISYTVTKGLNPGALMKDSGVEWMAQVPRDWRIVALRRVVRKFVDYRGRTPEKSRDGVLLVTAKNIRNGRLDFSDSREYIPENLYDHWMVRGLPERGDVLLTTEAPLGAVAQIEEPDVALAQRVILLKARRELVTNEYLMWYFMSDAGQGELLSQATGSTAEGIKASKFKAVYVYVPPLHLQEDISDFLDRQTARIDALIAKVQEGVERLKEYRTALISAAVTGKIDVRERA